MLKKFVFSIALFLAATVGGASQQEGAATDIYYLAVPQSVNMDTKTTTFSSQTVNPAIKNLILILAGQSNCSDVVPSAYSPVNPTKIDQLNIYDGAIRNAADPLIGTSYPRSAGVPVYGPGNAYLRVADTYISNGKFERVILVPICLGATSVANWAGFLQNTFTVAMRRLSAKGITAGVNVTIAAIWAQGETDTELGTSQAAYTASLTAFIAATRTAGFAGIWFINLESYSLGVTSINVINAQIAIVNHGASVWQGPSADAIVGNACAGLPCRQSDLTHWSDAGAVAIAAATVTAMGFAGAPF